MKMQGFKSFGRRFVGTTLLFSVTVSLGTSLILLLSSSAGYLPYSDRPGPGWWGRVHWPSWAESVNYIGFSPWFAYFCLYFGVGLFLLSLVLSFASTPRWLNRILGGIIAATAAALAITGAGWYFALAEIGSDSAATLGLLYGVFLFPRFIQPRTEPLSFWIRISTVACSVLLFSYWITSPFIPREPIRGLDYDLIRITAGDKTVAAWSLLGPELANELSALNIRGEAHGGIGGTGGSEQDAPHIDIEFLALEPITKEARLPVPKSGYVIYVLKNGTWTAHPSFTKKDRRTLTIEPGTDARYDGGRLKLGKEADFHAFTWYPVIPRGQ